MEIYFNFVFENNLSTLWHAVNDLQFVGFSFCRSEQQQQQRHSVPPQQQAASSPGDEELITQLKAKVSTLEKDNASQAKTIAELQSTTAQLTTKAEVATEKVHHTYVNV